MISVTSTSSPPISGTLTSLLSLEADAVAAGFSSALASAFASCFAGAASAAPSAESKIMISLPVSMVSPTATLISFTTPACGEGTSIEALSPSTVISDCSTSTLSPTFTIISVTSTASAPMSGTLISIAICLYLLCQTRVNFVSIDAELGNGFSHYFHIDLATFGQFAQCRNHNIGSVDFEVVTQVFAAVRTAETVGTQYAEIRSEEHTSELQSL